MDTGEILKVGKSEMNKYVGRFKKYVTAGNKTRKNLALDVFTVSKALILYNTLKNKEGRGWLIWDNHCLGIIQIVVLEDRPWSTIH